MLLPAGVEPIVVEEGPEVTGARRRHGLYLAPLPLCLGDLTPQVPSDEDACRRHLSNDGIYVAESQLVLAAGRDDVLRLFLGEKMRPGVGVGGREGRDVGHLSW